MTKSERNKFIKQIEKGSLELKDFSEEIKSDKEIVAASIKKDFTSFKFASDTLKSDISSIKEFLNINGAIFQYISDELKADRELCLLAIKGRGEQYQFAKNKDKNDKQFIVECVKLNGFSIKYMSDEIKDDFEVAKIAVGQPGYAFDYLSERLRNNYELLIDSVKQNKHGHMLKTASLELRSDEKLISELLNYVERNNKLIEYSSDNIKANHEIVLKAVKISGWDLKFVSSELKNSKDIVYAAVLENYESLKYASTEILDDLEFLNKLAELPRRDFQSLPILSCGSERVKNNRDLILKIMKTDGSEFVNLNDEFRSDEEIICTAIINVGHAARISPYIIPNGNEFLKYIIDLNDSNSNGYSSYNYGYKTELLISRERVLTVLNVNYSAFRYNKDSIPKQFMEDIEIINKINEKE